MRAPSSIELWRKHRWLRWTVHSITWPLKVGALVFPSAKGLELPPEVLAEHVRGALVALLAEGGSSRHPTRARVLTEPLSVDAGELTDKGYVNQRAVLTRRAAEVASLYAEPRHPHVLYLG